MRGTWLAAIVLISGCVGGPEAAPSTRMVAPTEPVAEPGPVYAERRNGSIELANPVLRLACDFELALCRAAALKPGLDHHLFVFRSVPADATHLNFTVNWTDDVAAAEAQVDLRLFDGSGAPLDFQYSFGDHFVDVTSPAPRDARLGTYQLMVWVNHGGPCEVRVLAEANTDPWEEGVGEAG